MTTRPWRAVASLRFGQGIPPVVLGRAAAKTRAGLDGFITRHLADGVLITVWEVQPIPEVTALTQAAASPAG